MQDHSQTLLDGRASSVMNPTHFPLLFVYFAEFDDGDDMDASTNVIG